MIEDEMMKEINKLKSEIAALDAELEKINNRTLQILMQRKKKEHELKILMAHFGVIEEKEIQTTLANLMKK